MNCTNNTLKSGIINVYKDKGYTSHDVVAILRKIFKIKKIGHTGTLDPEAKGVLPICIGKATKAANIITDKKKVYSTIMKLGIITDTQDHTGKIIEQRAINIDKENIIKIIQEFIGEIDQIPPMYSAIKIKGKKLYELAREGKIVERPSRKIVIYDIDNIKINNDLVSFTVECSKGTYIRTLCHDIGLKLGCGAHMIDLIREQSGPFKIDSALTLEQVEEYTKQGKINDYIINIDYLFNQYLSITIDSKFNKYLYNGNVIKVNWIKNLIEIERNNNYKVYDENHSFIGIYNCKLNSKNELILKPIKLFI